ncbi:MAG: hypothetical protein EU535_04095 [Promethearchaeota archaeon]|nr:MAG: hypothetical protein EU535_04095 [Candidatus Lokiarchaeota archaeon]
MSYFESRLRVDLEDLKETEKILTFCEKLDLKNLILEPKNDVKIISESHKKIIENFSNTNIYYRYTLKPKHLQDFRKRIKDFNKFPEILSVETPNKEIQIHAIRDSRVDLISFSHPEILKTLSKGVISLAKQNKKFIEFSLFPIIVDNKSIQSKNFRYLYRFIQKARTLKADYIISGDFNELFDIRHPRALMSICNTLLDIPLEELKKIFKENPRKLLRRIKKRRDNTILENGVKIIRNRGL